MIRCTLCVMPSTRPDTEFVDGVCSACLAYARRPQIDWAARKARLENLLNKHQGKCIVPSSGGKDSHYQVLKLIEMGAKPTVVTATTCHLTDKGRRNIDNLARYAQTIEVTPNRTVRAKLNRLGLELVGDISWPEHVSIFTTPFEVAEAIKIPLIFYGENPQNQYGGPLGTEDAVEMTRRWRSEFGGFLGLRPSDVVGQEGITADDMRPYELPAPYRVEGTDLHSVPLQVEAHFLGQYIPWDSHANAAYAKEHGFEYTRPGPADWWPHENQDNAQTGLHDHLMYRKFGYGRGCAQISVDIRAGIKDRAGALEWVLQHDGKFPDVYNDVDLGEVLRRIGMPASQLMKILGKFTNWDLFDGEVAGRPILKEER